METIVFTVYVTCAFFIGYMLNNDTTPMAEKLPTPDQDPRQNAE